MSYYKTWIDRSETVTNKQMYADYIKKYYTMEEKAYKTVLGAYPDNSEFCEGIAKPLAYKLGFDADTMDIFVGFLDGIKTSLKNQDALDLENVDDDTEIKLDIDYEKLFYNMLDAKAEWLYKMPEWKNILEGYILRKITKYSRHQLSCFLVHAVVCELSEAFAVERFPYKLIEKAEFLRQSRTKGIQLVLLGYYLSAGNNDRHH